VLFPDYFVFIYYFFDIINYRHFISFVNRFLENYFEKRKILLQGTPGQGVTCGKILSAHLNKNIYG